MPYREESRWKMEKPLAGPWLENHSHVEPSVTVENTDFPFTFGGRSVGGPSWASLRCD